MVRSAAALLLLFAAPARADDIGATARGVVRVVTIAIVDGEVVGFGHGSGVAVAPNRIVTNAHVVELAGRYPDNVVVGVVPSQGAKSYRGRVVTLDPERDLALIEFTGLALPPAAVFTGPVGDGKRWSRLAIPATSTSPPRGRRRITSAPPRPSGRRASSPAGDGWAGPTCCSIPPRSRAVIRAGRCSTAAGASWA